VRFSASYLAISLGDRFCVSRKSGTGGGGWVHPKDANSIAMSGLAHGWYRVDHFSLFKLKWTKKTVLSPCIPSPVFKANISARAS